MVNDVTLFNTIKNIFSKYGNRLNYDLHTFSVKTFNLGHLLINYRHILQLHLEMSHLVTRQLCMCTVNNKFDRQFTCL